MPVLCGSDEQDAGDTEFSTFLGGVSGSLDAFNAIVLQEQEGICVELHPPLRKKIFDILFDPGIIQQLGQEGRIVSPAALFDLFFVVFKGFSLVVAAPHGIRGGIQAVSRQDQVDDGLVGTGEGVRIRGIPSGAVIPEMVPSDDVCVFPGGSVLGGDPRAYYRVHLDQLEFIIQQAPAVHGDHIHDEQLSEVMAQRGVIGKIRDPFFGLKDLFRRIASGETDELLGLYVKQMPDQAFCQIGHHIDMDKGGRVYRREQFQAEFLQGHGAGKLPEIGRKIGDQGDTFQVDVAVLGHSPDIVDHRPFDGIVALDILVGHLQSGLLCDPEKGGGGVQIEIKPHYGKVVFVPLLVGAEQPVAGFSGRQISGLHGSQQKQILLLFDIDIGQDVLSAPGIQKINGLLGIIVRFFGHAFGQDRIGEEAPVIIDAEFVRFPVVVRHQLPVKGVLQDPGGLLQIG